MQEDQIRAAPNAHWLASAIGDAIAEHDIMEFRDGKVVHETQYFADPFEAPAWRKQWVQAIAASTK